MPVRWQPPIPDHRRYTPGFYDRKPDVVKAESKGLEARLLDLISDAAKAGDRCPTDIQLMDALGLLSQARLAALFRSLEESGQLTVERYKSFRVATVAETGLRTREKGVRKRRPSAPKKYMGEGI